MNNDLEQFSEERLKELSNINGNINTRFCDADIEALARIALAAKQAKPVGVFYPTAFYIKGQYKLFTIDEAKHSGLIRNGILNESYSYMYDTPRPAHTEQDGWIKCSDRMPDCLTPVLVHVDYRKTPIIDWLNDNTGYFHTTGTSATHWMPLPATPKPESE